MNDHQYLANSTENNNSIGTSIDKSEPQRCQYVYYRIMAIQNLREGGGTYYDVSKQNKEGTGQLVQHATYHACVA